MDRWGAWTKRAGRLAGELAQAQAGLVELTRELLAGSGWAGDGVKSPEHWLQVYAGVSAGQARALVRVAERGAGLEPVTGLMAQGRMTLDQAMPIAEHVPDRSVAEVARLGEVLTVSQLRRVTARYPFERVQPAREEPRSTLAQQPTELVMSSFGGRFTLRFSTTAVEGALVEQAIREAKDSLFTAGNPRVSLAEGLVEVAARSLRGVSSGSRRELYKVVLHLSTDGSGWVQEKGAVPGVLLDRYTCGGSVKPVWETQSVPVAVGRSLRIVPDRTRVLVEDRDRGCRYPGCGVGGFLENHHLVHWKDGGPTDPDNLVSLCPLHHRQVHLGEYSISGDPGRVDGLVFTGGSGRVGKYIGYGMPKQPLRVVAGRPEPIRVGIRGERLDLGAVYFNTAEHPEPQPPESPGAPGAGPEPPAPPGSDRIPA
ncbi:HNH endonuclease signature motif containing protein [Aestuariimicrobium sp. Y1814]|uniref:HNH endonuclease signature motif containing protein n=1 Tax=Aestuariimicrobium sp. Y1814 TaxID=3418742 RepID=UPI003DA75581